MKIHQKKIFGVTLVELIIAMAISSVLMVGVGSIYSNTKRTYFVQDEFGRTQENSRYALDVLAKEIRNTGYLGCKNLALLTPNNLLVDDTILGGVDYNPSNFILGHTIDGGGTASPLIPGIAPSGLVPSSHAVTIRSASGCQGTLTSKTEPDSTSIEITSACQFSLNDIVLITDCERADIFSVTIAPAITADKTLTHSQGVSGSSFLSKVYDDNATVFKLTRNTYYLKTDAISGNPSLYVQELISGATVENQIADNVQDMLIDYGVDLDFKQDQDNLNPGADTFLTAAQINVIGNNPLNYGNPLWANVVNVRIRLLLQSNNLSERERQYQWDGSTITPATGDYRIRQAYHMTINLRNRTP